MARTQRMWEPCFATLPTISTALHKMEAAPACIAIGGGTLFKLSGSTETILYDFNQPQHHCGDDGSNPVGAVVMDSSGNIYGTTYAGGSAGCGTVWEQSGSNHLVLHDFNCAEPSHPAGGVIFDSSQPTATNSLIARNRSHTRKRAQGRHFRRGLDCRERPP
jgi:hypothetical protein